MKKYSLAIFFMMALLFSCKEDEHEPLVKNDNKPGILTNVKVENIQGGAKISYTLPNDQDLLYVQAIFSSKSGEERIVKSSIYKNFVVLDGFADTDEYQVKLQTVNRAETPSDPVAATISPLTPPLQTLFSSMQVSADFGGVRYSFQNELGEEYVIHTLLKNEVGNWVSVDKLYTKAKSRTYSVRGLPAVERQFGFVILDRWKNRSDTLKATLLPLFEEELDKKLWRNAALATDFYTPFYSNRPISKIWDDKHGTLDYFIAAGAPNVPPLPNWFTIDLGKASKLSRMKINQYEGVGSYLFALGNPRKFEIWATNNPTNDWADWTLLLECESIKPSGLPIGIRTAEDVAYGLAGEDYTFPTGHPPYRYIRFKLIETWARVDNLLLDELTLWGGE